MALGTRSYAQRYLGGGGLPDGVKGLINLFGIESPGLTSSLSLANEVVAQLDG